ncbi:glycosyltransferase [Acetobacterium wieringae]|uniref:Glycosyltransferase n=1 Tax=Acetobacterium wieringae TaxID=52694 RepID=A0A5D0WGW1_9FIRM|nr:glycosyltransferase [Acetobacterium wieringae]TYC82197.1 glycosyltransferase [Acetobacterium wieringae]
MNESSVTVSLIVPIYNCENYLIDCLESILNQSYDNIEIILINDGSTDSSFEICKQFGKLDSRIVLLQHENQGVGYTRNIGINNAKGKYIMFIDGDDIIDKNIVINLFSRIENDNSDLAVCGIVAFNETDKTKKYIRSINKVNEDDHLTAKEYLEYLIIYKTDVYFGSPDNKIYRKDIIDNNNIRFYQDYDFGEDFLFNIEYLNYVRNISMTKENLYHYRRDNNSSITKKSRDTIAYWSQFKYIFSRYSGLMKKNRFLKKDINAFIIMGFSAAIWNSFLQYPFFFSKKRKVVIRKMFADLCMGNLDVNLKKLSYEEMITYYLLKIEKLTILEVLVGVKFKLYKIVKYIKLKGK